MNADALLAEANKLSVDDRLRLVHDIWDSIAEEPQAIRLSETQKRELERRIAASDANPDELISWDELKTRLQARRS